MMNSINYLKGMMLAQLGVPIGVVVYGVLFGTPSLGDLLTLEFYSQIFIFSIIGLFFSTPACILIGVPLSFILEKIRCLNQYSAFIVCISIPFIAQITMGGLGGISYVCASVGGLIYARYLKKVGALTKRSKTTR